MSVQTVFVNEIGGLLVEPLVMQEMDLIPGQSISEEQMWEIIAANAAVFAAEIDLRRIAGEQNLPDTTELHRLLANGI